VRTSTLIMNVSNVEGEIGTRRAEGELGSSTATLMSDVGRKQGRKIKENLHGIMVCVDVDIACFGSLSFEARDGDGDGDRSVIMNLIPISTKGDTVEKSSTMTFDGGVES
jgi:hypothetical protein